MQNLLAEHPFMLAVFRLPFVERVYLFGSRARGDNSDRSDIDLAIECPNATQEDWSKLTKIIEYRDTLLKIDCVRLDSLEGNDPLLNNIERYKVLLFDRGTGYMDKAFWKDYFEGLGDAVDRLGELINHPDLEQNEYMQDACIQRFEFCIELYWKVLKKFLAYEKVDSTTPRNTLELAYQYKLINDEKIWINMMDDRNRTSHMYKQSEAKIIFEHIKDYYPVMKETYESLRQGFY